MPRYTTLEKFLLLTLLCVCVRQVFGSCPNLCNGHGKCDKYSRCTCDKTFQGGDCSERSCPFSAAWSDMPIATDLAHQSAECSNRGICDRTNGQCLCMEGFSGSACERLNCENDCNDQGICISIFDLASRNRNDKSEQFTYTHVPGTIIGWDAEKIHGCKCDPGKYGYDCSLKSCSSGDDPLTSNQVNDVQLIKCSATVGSFSLFFEGSPSTSIPHTANQADVTAAILSITGITAVKVTFSQSVHAAVCQTNNPNIVTIEFTQEFGELSPLVALPDAVMLAAGGRVQISADGSIVLMDDNNVAHVSVKGTKENDICSNRGLCSREEGLCKCFDSYGDVYASSNGYGVAGARGDCGYLKATTGNTASSCPGELSCSGHGNCDTSTWRCGCSVGWAGGDCSEKVCPQGYAWFGYPSADNTAHDEYAECSAMGHCDYATGKCKCRPNFYGEACEYMACDEGAQSGFLPCSGHGRCLSMAELAYEADDNGDATEYVYGYDKNGFSTTWDYSRIHGCLCDVGFSGYDCSLHDCPSGDDPGTYDDHQEVQLLQCVASSGNFTLSFRQDVTWKMPYTATASDIREALVALPSIQNVYVYMGTDVPPPNGTLNHVVPFKPFDDVWRYIDQRGVNGSFERAIPLTYPNATTNASFCETDGHQTLIVSFDYTPGNVPSLIVNAEYLEDSVNSDGVPGSGKVLVFTDGQSVNGLTSLVGTTEDAPCNNRGTCDRRTGSCACFADWWSSDGSIQGPVGFTGDCGFRDTRKTGQTTDAKLGLYHRGDTHYVVP